MGRRPTAIMMRIYGVCEASAHFRSGARRPFHAHLRHFGTILGPIFGPAAEKKGACQKRRAKNLCVFTAFGATLRPKHVFFRVARHVFVCICRVCARAPFLTLKNRVLIVNMRVCSGLGGALGLARGAGLGADCMRIYGKCAHWASNWQAWGSIFYEDLR